MAFNFFVVNKYMTSRAQVTEQFLPNSEISNRIQEEKYELSDCLLYVDLSSTLKNFFLYDSFTA